MSSVAVVFTVLFVLLNVMLTIFIVQPIMQLARTADMISKGRLDMPDFSNKGRDEVSQLGQAFNRMRRSLSKAIALIDKG
jgi:protein-histidine pros-kinase